MNETSFLAVHPMSMQQGAESGWAKGLDGATNSPRPVTTDVVDVFNHHKPRLFSIAYRMLGSASDAEDMLQETFVRWQSAASNEIDSPEAFLVTIVTRVCLNHLQSSRVKREQYFGQWLPEPVLTSTILDPLTISEMDESLSLAFLVLLERLNPTERAVFLLREIFDYDYADIATILGQSESNCRQILRRARQHLKDARPRFTTSQEERQELLERFVQASRAGDMEALLAVFSKEIVLYADGGGKATAVPNPIYGVDNVIRFLLGARKKLIPGDLVNRMAQVNGEPGIVSYLNGRPFSVLTIEVIEGRIRNIFIVSNPDKLARLQTPAPPC